MQYLIERYGKLCATVGQTFGGRILDFCCGDGKVVSFLRDAGFDVFGFEPFDGVAPSARHFASAGWQNPYAVRGGPAKLDFDWRGLRLPYADDAFDIVISQEVFEHVRDHQAAFRELARVTRAGGVGIHTFPSRYRLIEPHIKVPLGGIFKSERYYLAWYALTGINPMGNDASPATVAAVEAHYAKWSLNYPPPREILRTARRFFRQALFAPELWEGTRLPWLYTRFKHVVLVVSDPLS